MWSGQQPSGILLLFGANPEVDPLQLWRRLGEFSRVIDQMSFAGPVVRLAISYP
jgi:hypothetical protein